MPPLLIAPPAAEALPREVVLAPPPSKSEALRALAAAAVAGGGRVAMRAPWPDDVHVLLDGLERLGVAVARDPQGATVGEATLRRAPLTLDARDGGAPARFLLALAARLSEAPVTVTGSPRLRERPMGPLLRALAALGARVDGGERLPATVQGPLEGGVAEVDAALSSQFASALLLVAPGLPKGLVLRVPEPAAAAPYVELTRAVMAAFGVELPSPGEVPAGTRYRRDVAFATGGDWSGAAFLLAAAAFLGRPVRVTGLDRASRQPDVRIAGILASLGLDVRADGRDVVASGRIRNGGRFDLRATPDLAPPLAALGALAPAPLELEGLAALRVKESDRLAALEDLLRAAGARVARGADRLSVAGPLPATPSGPPLAASARGDHRIAMAAALLGLARPLLLDDPDCVAKSFPGFFARWPGTAAAFVEPRRPGAV